MSRLMVDNKDLSIVKSDESLQKDLEMKETFDKAVNDAIENKYKSEESEEVYAMFNPSQRQLLDSYFRGFSVELYKELNGTVELQIQKRNEKIKAKVQKLSEEMGMKKFNLDDWVYDGMNDAGKNAGQKCDLCPRPVRYAHFAANKKTHEVLRFGCNCAADFFQIDKSSLSSMKTIQSKTLRDIKIIAIIMEKGWLKEYYTYMAGHTGNVLLNEGVDGLRDLTSFVVKWNGDTLVGDKEKDLYPIKFGDGVVAEKSSLWIKSNIISCLNADLDANLYNKLEDRTIVKLPLKEEDRAQLNTTGYVKYAMKFVEVGLPIPKSLCDKLNRIISKSTRQHHPDYLKYTQDLLISNNLEKSNLLKTAFTDFIVSYLSEKIGNGTRDPELEYWGIRGEKSFYNTVLTWETMLVKLMAINEIKSLVSKGLISEEELNRVCEPRHYVGFNYGKIKNYVDDCSSLFLSKKSVKTVDENLANGYSKYMLEGLDKKVGLDMTRGTDGYKSRKGIGFDFIVDIIPFNVACHYATIQNGFKTLTSDSLAHIHRFLKCIPYLETDEELMSLLCALSTNSKGLVNNIMDCEGYRLNNLSKDKILDVALGYNRDGNKILISNMCKKYKGTLKKFRKDCLDLDAVIVELLSKFKSYKADKKPSEIFDDYDDLVFKQEQTNRDYFEEYCDLLIAKRGNKGMLQYLKQKNLYDLVAFKKMEPYADMLKDIMSSYSDAKQDAEEEKLYDYLNLEVLKTDIKKFLDAEDLDIFTTVMTFILCKEQGLYDRTPLPYINMWGYADPLRTASLVEDIKKEIPEEILTKCINEYSDDFEALYNALKSLFMGIKTSPITFDKHYKLLMDLDTNVLKSLRSSKSYISVESYRDAVCYNLRNIDVNYDIKYSNGNSYNGLFFTGIGCYKGIRDIKEKLVAVLLPMIEEQKELREKKEQEERIKGPVLRQMERYLDEHIKFFEIDVAAERRKGGYSNYSDNGIRRDVAFNEVDYESSSEELSRFVEELKNSVDRNDWHDGVEEVVGACTNINSIEFRMVKKYRNALRAECYNHNLIYNHFDLTYKLLKELKAMDLNELEVSEIKELTEILRKYYLFKSGMKSVWSVLTNHNATAIDFATEHNNLPKPNILDIKEVLIEDEGKRDKSGLTGVEKAIKVKEHPDFSTLDSLTYSIVNTVSSKKTCSDKQLYYVNKACITLGIIKADDIKADDITTEKNDVQSGDDIKSLALKVITHPDFPKLSDIERGVSTTVSKTGRCSDKQKKFLDSAIKKLNIQ